MMGLQRATGDPSAGPPPASRKHAACRSLADVWLGLFLELRLPVRQGPRIFQTRSLFAKYKERAPRIGLGPLGARAIKVTPGQDEKQRNPAARTHYISAQPCIMHRCSAAYPK